MASARACLPPEHATTLMVHKELAQPEGNVLYFRNSDHLFNIGIISLRSLKSNILILLAFAAVPGHP